MDRQNNKDIKEPQKFYLGYIEFDDMGELWSIGNLSRDYSASQPTSQLATVLKMIDDAKKAGRDSHSDVEVIVFVHGWHNNASPHDEEYKEHENLSSFKTILQQFVDQGYTGTAYPNNPAIIVGIVLSWRGQMVVGDLFTTYWNRRDAAVRVGGQAFTETIMRLMFDEGRSPSSYSRKQMQLNR